jgi:hypothetical protein
VFVNHEFLLL